MGNEEKLREYLKRTAQELQLAKSRLKELEGSSHEPIAIVSMSCRLPGGVSTPEALWRLLKRGEIPLLPFPKERGWDAEALYDPDPDAAGKSYVKAAGFLEDALSFDPGFFGVSPREALRLDPQQRLLLESAWEALERAGIPPASLEKSLTGVYLGVIYSDYGARFLGSPEAMDGYVGIGSAGSTASGRISYTLGLQGPAVSVDTACSSSLVAVHLAMQALRQGECNLALAGGVTVMATPQLYIEFSRQHGMAADGKCKPFSEEADGAAFSEGCGVLVLERLSDARRNGHRVLAVLSGSAINQDGRSQGLTAPNGPSQERVIEAALASAGITAKEVQAVEAHGTGTQLGDPIEAGALLATYGKAHVGEAPLYLGALKSNIGHTQAAAGVAGIIKMVLALQHEELPPSRFADRPMRKVSWDEGNLKLLSETVPWRHQAGQVRRAGVSSFGISGTNAHVILEEAPAAPAAAESPAAAVALETVPLVVSGRTEEALRANAARLAEHLTTSGARLVDVAYSLATRRSAFEERVALGAGELPGALERLKQVAAGTLPKGAVRATAGASRVVFLYPGQGSQSVGMCRSLLKDAAFRADLEACDAALRPHTGFSVVEVLEQGEEAQKASLAKVTVVQPLLWAVAVALTRLWERWGVKPAAVVGHSQGEVAAAVVAGALTLEEGARVVAVRSRLVAGLSGDGAMASVGLPVAEVEARLKERKSSANVAVVNSRQSTAIAGERQAVEALVAEYEAAGVFCRRIAVDYASHSPQVDAALPGIREELKGLRPSTAKVAMYSTVTGGKVEGTELSGGYWADNLRKPVRLDLALEALGGAQETVLLEVSAHPVLSGALGGTYERVVASLRREGDAASGVRFAAAELHTHGVKVAWERLFEGTGAREVELPTYAFERQRFWLEASQKRGGSVEEVGLAEGAHPLLGSRAELPDGGALFTGLLEVARQKWMEDHQVFETVLVPGVAMVELAAHAAKQLGLDGVLEAVLAAPLALEGRGGRRLQLVVGPAEKGARAFALRSQAATAAPSIPSGVEGPWVQHATGLLGSGLGAPAPLPSQWPPPGAKPLDVTGLYERLKGMGFGYGPSFQVMKRAWATDEGLYAEVALTEPTAREAGEYGVHPALFDGALHPLLTQTKQVQLPFSWGEVQVHAVGATAVRVKLTREGEGWRVALYDGLGQPVASVGSLQARAATVQQVKSALAGASQIYELSAQPVTEQEPLDVAVVEMGWAKAKFGEPLPEATRVVRWPNRELGAQAVHESTQAAISWAQAWLKDERLEKSRVVWLTQRALSLSAEEAGADPSAAAVWGIGRTLQAEHPDRRLVLLDVDEALSKEALKALVARLPEDEGQLALRQGQLKALRLKELDAGLPPPEGAAAWRLEVGEKGRLDRLELIPAPECEAALKRGEVRLSIRASGLNFRDVLTALGMYPGEAGPIGVEGAGVVTEVGEGVQGLKEGDRVFGMLPRAFGTVAVADARTVRRIPAGLTFAEAASLPATFLTVLYAFEDLAQLKRGERLLVHAAAGGVGLAAVQMARHVGADLYVTASRPKWELLRKLGIPQERISSSRDTGFEKQFLAETKGQGMDVVLGSLHGELVDASLRLLPRGGRYVEMGKRDVRDAAKVASAHPGVTYRAFDLIEAGPERMGQLLDQVVQLLGEGKLKPLPVQAYDVREAPSAFRFMSKGGHVGKIVLTQPRPLGGEGTVLLTGGTGGLARITARHLVKDHGVKHLLLLSRSGRKAEGAPAFVEELKQLGAVKVDLVACDVSNPYELKRALGTISREHPLRAVIHLAMVLDDALLAELSPERVVRVLWPKVDAAFHLHELTRGEDLAAFILFSSAAGTMNSAAQGSYAAANAALDALASHRRAQGLPAVSLGWGMWGGVGAAAAMSEALQSRLRRAGFAPIDAPLGMRLMDEALQHTRGHCLPMPLDLKSLARIAADKPEGVPSLLRGLVRGPARRASAAGTRATGAFAERLAGLPAEERDAWVLDFVRTEISAVFGLSGPAAVAPERPLKELGLDSLSAVELRNRLANATALRLPATLMFDFPTASAVAGRLLKDVAPRAATKAPARATQTQEHAREPIAIVSMSCRLPGGVQSPEGLWRLMQRGEIPLSPFPKDRGWDVDALYDPDPEAPGKSYVKQAGFLEDALSFDPGFFGVSPREALRLDPQQRLLLESSWEALERAGIPPKSLEKSLTGVYVGVAYADYGARFLDRPEGLDGYVGIGSAGSTASGRISYTLGLQGPAVSIDTACSSSLVAMHLAMQALRNGECDLALAGGVTVLATPQVYIEFSRQRGLAPDANCKPFSDLADGTAFSEGCGMVVLERLSDARRNGHRVLALLRGSAINQDGRSQGLTAPNGPSQERVIEAALASAGVTAKQVQAVEAHGTGTQLGDPIEAGALLATYGKAHLGEAPLYVGALKSNIGHTQAAAGVAGVIKMVLALQHEELPASRYADNPTRKVSWDEGNLKLLSETVPWRRQPGQVRRAGVSSFGISGTNAHVILEEPPPIPAADGAAAPATVALETVPLVLSGRSPDALRANAARLAGHLKDGKARLLDVAYSLATRRNAFEERLALGAGDLPGAIERLEQVAAGALPKGAVKGAANRSRVVFLIPGHGSQYPDMCRGLLADPAFRSAVDACDAALRPLTGFSVLEVLQQDKEAQERAFAKGEVLQPVLFAVAIALARVWERLGVRPSAVIGHSLGEASAAVLSGALTLEEGARVVAVRSRLVRPMFGQGMMASIALPCEQVQAKLKDRSSKVNVAVVNSKQSTAVAGDRAEVEALVAEYEAAGVFCRRIGIDYASHSPQMDPALPGMRDELKGLKPAKTRVTMISTVTGGRVEGTELGGGYWADNLRKPVRLDLALEALGGGQETAFLELSAHPVLSAVVAGAGYTPVVASLRREGEAASGLRLAAAELHAHGVKVGWEAVFEGTGAREVELPTYAFERQRYWLEAGRKKGGSVEEVGLEEGAHPLLGSRVELPDGGVLFAGLLDTARHAWMADHQVFDTVLVPGAAMVELAAHAAKQVGLEGVLEAVLEAPLALEARGGRRAQLVLGPLEGGARSFTLRSQPAAGGEAPWTQHATGAVGTGLKAPAPLPAQWPPPGATAVELGGLYERLKGQGFGYGPAFQVLQGAWAGKDALYAEVTLREAAAREAGEYGVHPALLDGALHAVLTQLQTQEVQLPFAWGGVQVHAVGATTARVKLTREGEAWRVELFDGQGQPVVSVDSLQARPATLQQVKAALAGASHLYEVTAQPVAEQEPRELTVIEVSPGAQLRGETRSPPVTPSEVEGRPASPPPLDSARGDRDAEALLLVRWPSRPLTAQAVHEATQAAVAWVQAWLKDETLEKRRVVWLTQRAYALGADEPGAHPAAAAIWGVGRTVQAEHPDRPFVLLDADEAATAEELHAALSRLPPDEGQLVLRHGQLRALRLKEAPDAALSPPPAAAWRLAAGKGGLEKLALVPSPEGAAALQPGEVRLSVRASGLNFRDVLTALGMYPGDPGPIGIEGAGVVTELGAGVRGLAPGDRVFGLFPRAFGSMAVADARTVRQIPDGLSFAEAASLPATFLTAFYALEDLAHLKTGERLLVHAAAGGVGLAAVQLARLRGAELYVTASKPKWELLRRLGIPQERIASSRDTGFEQRFLAETRGQGMDVVLGSLHGEFVDASLRLLPRGGRYLEMGKRDVRDAAQVERAHPGVRYRAFDLMEGGPERLGQLLEQVVQLLGEGKLQPLPVQAYDVREAPTAFRFMSKGGHVGKIVLTQPRPLGGEGTVLVTGGTGGLAGVTARHLVKQHGVRHLLLLSRSGARADGAAALVEELKALGAATVDVVACDVSKRPDLERALAALPRERPLRAVIHLAMVLDDGLLADLRPERVERVLRPKVDAAFHLHELTRGLDLAAFVLFSSAAGTLNSAAQGSYAAANAALDALASHRRASGLPGVSLAWGLWSGVGVAAALSETLQSRLRRSGIAPIDRQLGMRLLDEAVQRPSPHLVLMRLDRKLLQATANAAGGRMDVMFRGLVRKSHRQAAAAGAAGAGWTEKLARLPAAERTAAVLERVRGELASILGMSESSGVSPSRNFRELGVDSLIAVELRHRLSGLFGSKLSPTLVFDHPTADQLAQHLSSDLANGAPASEPVAQLHGEQPRSAPPGKPPRPSLPGPFIAEPWLSTVKELPFTPRIGTQRSVLLTGATGFLGVHLLDALLETEVPKIVVLIRAKDDAEAEERLTASVDRWGFAPLTASQRARVVARAGDLSLPQLGLTAERWRSLANETSEIIANGAVVDWVSPFRRLAAANVGGTAELLRLASAGQHRRFSFVSTLSIHLVGELDQPNYWDDARILRGYTLSKLAAEHLVSAAAANGLSTAIFRPAVVTTGAVKGLGNTRQAEHHMLRAVFNSRLVPDGGVGDLTPADYCARAIVSRALDTRVMGEVDVIHPRAATSQLLCRWVGEAGLRASIAPAETFAAQARAAAPPGDLGMRVVEMILNVRAAHGIAGGATLPEDALAARFTPEAAVRRTLTELMGEVPQRAATTSRSDTAA